MIVYGRNPVTEALLGKPSSVEEVLISEGVRRERFLDVIRLARENGVKVSFLPQRAISKIAGTSDHQGIVARVLEFEYGTIDGILGLASRRKERPLVVILDHIEDPQNLGAIIRTVNVLGAHGVLIPKDRAAGVTPAVIKASAGAVSFVQIARVVNLVRTIRDLKKRGIWIVGADQGASKSVFEAALGDLDLALVIGSEGRGLGRLVKEECDFLLSIPSVGEVSSLNASVAAGIMIYEIVRQRRSIHGRVSIR